MILLGNCLEILPTFEGESFDAVITDPPYNISNENVISRGSQGKYKGQDLTHDYHEWDKFDCEYDYYVFTQGWVAECARLLKPGGFLISFFDKRRLSWIFDVAEFEQEFRGRLC